MFPGLGGIFSGFRHADQESAVFLPFLRSGEFHLLPGAGELVDFFTCQVLSAHVFSV